MKGARLRVLHVVAGLHPDHGGPSRTVVSLADSIAADPDWDVRLLTQARRGSPVVEQRSVAVRMTVAVSPSPLLCSLGVPALRQGFRPVKYCEVRYSQSKNNDCDLVQTRVLDSEYRTLAFLRD